MVFPPLAWSFIPQSVLNTICNSLIDPGEPEPGLPFPVLFDFPEEHLQCQEGGDGETENKTSLFKWVVAPWRDIPDDRFCQPEQLLRTR
jgi:hypothetical protein